MGLIYFLLLICFIVGLIGSKRVYTFIWNVSEFTGIGLGKYAPYVFGKMLGKKGKNKTTKKGKL